MTGFDNTFRSQAWAEEQNWRATAAKMQAYDTIGDVAQHTVERVQDYGLRKAESDAQIQMWETQRQIQQRKLAEMQAIDLAKQSRLTLEGMQEQVRSAKLANDQAEFQYGKQRQQSDYLGGDQERWMMHEGAMSKIVPDDPEARVDQGWVRDPKTRMWRIGSDEEIAKERKRMLQERLQVEEVRHPGYNVAARDMGALTNAIKAQVDIAQSELRQLDQADQYFPEMTEEQVKQRRKELNAQLRQLDRELTQGRSALFGGQQKQPEQGPSYDTDAEFEKLWTTIGEQAKQGNMTIGVITDAVGDTDYEGLQERLKGIIGKKAAVWVQRGAPPDWAYQKSYLELLDAVRAGNPSVLHYLKGAK